MCKVKFVSMFVLLALLVSVVPGAVLAVGPTPPQVVALQGTSGSVVDAETIYAPVARGHGIQPSAIVPSPGGKNGEARSTASWRNYFWFAVETSGSSTSRVLDGKIMDYLWVKGTLTTRYPRWNDWEDCSVCGNASVSSPWVWDEPPFTLNEHGEHHFMDGAWDSGIITTDASAYMP